MPATYSINNNTVYEANRLANITDALYLLPDNTFKLISPKDVRDAVFTAWESSVFKQTSGSSSVEYIGIDRDIKQKIFFGKKKLGNIDVLNSTLLNYNFNDTDIFFFNNKPGVTPSSTKISILAGTNSFLYQLAPYIESYGTTNSTLNLDIVNQTGDIILDSLTGRVSINNVVFPTKQQTASASNGQILKYQNGSLVWGDNTISLATIGGTSTVTNIFGSPVLINGYNMELSETSPIIATFGHIYVGQTFSDAPIVEVVRQMLYPYLPPVPSLFVNVNGTGLTKSAIAERGSITSPSSIVLNWSITKMSDPVISGLISNSTGFSFTSITQSGMITVTGSATGNIPVSSITYNLQVTDSGVSDYTLNSGATISSTGTPNNYSDSATLVMIYPYFWGVSPVNATNASQVNSILGSLTKSVSVESDKVASLSGTGYLYFIYPAIYGTLSTIFDENGFDLTTSFTYSQYISSINSPSSFWTNQSYYVYKYGPLTVGTPSSVNWQFKY